MNRHRPTSLVLPPLGLGCSTFGNLFGAVSDAEVEAMVRNAPPYFDVAPWYGLAEERLGRALRDIPTPAGRRAIISTKVGRYRTESGECVFDYSAAATTASVHRSLRLLGVPSLDIVFVHDVEFAPSPDVIVQQTVPALRALQDGGLIGHIGVSGYPLDALLRVVDLVPAGTVAFAMTYGHLNLHDRTLEAAAPLFGDRGVTVIAAAPLSMGLLTDAGPPDWHPCRPALRSAARRAAEVCRSSRSPSRTENRLESVALRHGLRLARDLGVTTVCSARTDAELQENMRELAGRDDEDQDDILDGSIADIFGALDPDESRW